MIFLIRACSIGTSILACLLGSYSVPAATLLATPKDFDSVFAAAASGDIIAMKGTFGEVRLRDRTFTKKLTLDASGATFNTTMILDNINNVQVTGGNFNIVGSGQYAKAVAVWGGNNIYIRFATVLGSADQFGVLFAGTHNAQVTNSKFDGLNAAILYNSVTSGYAGSNVITGATSDGIDISDSHGVTAIHNICLGGKPVAGAHPDCIQMWSVAGRPLQSDNSVIANSAYGPTQGFTSFSGGGGGLRLTISENVVNTSYTQGIACYDCINSIINNNKISTQVGSTYQTTLRVIGGSGNVVQGNIVAPYSEPRSSEVTNDAVFGDVERAPLDGSEAAEPILGQSGIYSPASTLEAVPELSTWILFLIGFCSVGCAVRRSPGAGRAAPSSVPHFTLSDHN